MIESLYAVPQRAAMKSRQTMAYEMIDILLNGLRSREMLSEAKDDKSGGSSG